MVLRAVVAQQAVEAGERKVTLAEEHVRALEGFELFGKLAVFYIAAQNAGRYVLPEGDGIREVIRSTVPDASSVYTTADKDV